MVFKGTSKRPTSRDISEAIEGVGGTINGGTDKEMTVYWCKVAQPHFPIALDVLSDMLLNAKFDASEIERERQVIMEEINLCRDFPSQRADMLMDELLWANHPLGREIAGTKESVSTLTRAQLLGWMGCQYVPSNSAVAIAGNIKHEDMVAAVSETLKEWQNTEFRREYLPYKEQLSPRVRIETRDTEQTQICLGLPGLSIFDPMRFALDMLNIILGEGMSSRLFTEVRDKLGLAYSISSYVDHYQDSGSLIIPAGVDAKNLKAAIGAIVNELAKLKEPIPESELTKAKEMSKGRMLLRLEDSRSVSGWMGGQEILTERIYSVDEIVSIIDGITAEELMKLARKLITGKKLRLAIVGPIQKDEPLEDLLKI
jgi:predicted Zn-dependent peptidase